MGVGPVSAALGSVANLFSSKMLMKYQYKLNRKLRRRGYQDTMFSMREAGLNPILAYKTGAVTSGGVGLAQTPDFGGNIAKGLQADAASSQASSAKSLRRAQQDAADAQREMFKSQGGLADANATGVNLENVKRAIQADYWRTTEGGIAIRGREIGGIYGPPAAAVTTGARAFQRHLGESLQRYEKNIKRSVHRNWVRRPDGSIGPPRR